MSFTSSSATSLPPASRKRRAITRDEVARAAGVSKVTASIALRGVGANSQARVSETTRERIRQLAKELGYRPDVIASSLRASGPTPSACDPDRGCSSPGSRSQRWC